MLVLGGLRPSLFVAACARFSPVRRVGLGPDYRRGAVRAGEHLSEDYMS
jgi:hypothetical protein